MIYGLLKWIGKNIHTPYYTGPGAVVRIAACLQEVGYTIPSVSTWNGNGEKSRTRRSVVLILSGSHETDPMMEETPFISLSISFIPTIVSRQFGLCS